MVYTKIPKPTGRNYTNVVSKGLFYDDPNVMYDDPNVFFDGIVPTTYTNISKPSSTSYTKINKPT